MKSTTERIKQYFTETDPEKFHAQMVEDLGEHGENWWKQAVIHFMTRGNSVETASRLAMEAGREALLTALATPKVLVVERGHEPVSQYPTSKYVH